jgi:hypothetical protein
MPTIMLPIPEIIEIFKNRYVIRDREAGYEIETAESLEEAEQIMEKFIKEDKANGFYEPKFYEIYDKVKEEIISISE